MYGDGQDMKTVNVDGGSVIFYNEKFCTDMTNVNKIHIDATFKCWPQCLNLGRSGQFLTIMGMQHNHVSNNYLKDTFSVNMQLFPKGSPIFGLCQIVRDRHMMQSGELSVQ